MADSIKEQILTAFGNRLAAIRTANQYNSDMGAEVLRSFLPALSSSIVPCIGFAEGVEENTALYSRSQMNILPVRVQGIAAFGDVLAPVMAGRLYADICECVLCEEWTLSFDSGGTSQIVAGDRITGADSGATALVISVSLQSGTWGAGNAAGQLLLRRVSGWFQDNENLNVGVSTNLAAVNGSPTGQGEVELSTGGLADAITFFSGEVHMPDADGQTVGADITFNIRYDLIAGNPYSQE